MGEVLSCDVACREIHAAANAVDVRLVSRAAYAVFTAVNAREPVRHPAVERYFRNCFGPSRPRRHSAEYPAVGGLESSDGSDESWDIPLPAPPVWTRKAFMHHSVAIYQGVARIADLVALVEREIDDLGADGDPPARFAPPRRAVHPRLRANDSLWLKRAPHALREAGFGRIAGATAQWQVGWCVWAARARGGGGGGGGAPIPGLAPAARRVETPGGAVAEVSVGPFRHPVSVGAAGAVAALLRRAPLRRRDLPCGYPAAPDGGAAAAAGVDAAPAPAGFEFDFGDT